MRWSFAVIAVEIVPFDIVETIYNTVDVVMGGAGGVIIDAVLFAYVWIIVYSNIAVVNTAR